MEILKLQNPDIQHNCTVKKVDDKGKESLCNGHLREWLTPPDNLRAQLGAGETYYRCRRCGAVYRGTIRRHLRGVKVANRELVAQPALPTQFPLTKA
ncbi:MAG: hypothetical protein SNJ67_06255 [Chloracidobacterium sp.]|uniref:Mut7-C RNAse domain-containing protein n=1 Tax=Chloracidobacterium validum TaxID=2821543 RepID=A0ABX8BCS2_9BACT|nr:hypothetical protein [Chloracidobacterium validum]QUW04486.1 hypothetical protein J8C06_11900 [Chloracidobacterium validum]